MHPFFPVHFENLHKIKLPVGVVEGFDLSFFDDARGIVRPTVKWRVVACGGGGGG